MLRSRTIALFSPLLLLNPLPYAYAQQANETASEAVSETVSETVIVNLGSADRCGPT